MYDKKTRLRSDTTHNARRLIRACSLCPSISRMTSYFELAAKEFYSVVCSADFFNRYKLYDLITTVNSMIACLAYIFFTT